MDSALAIAFSAIAFAWVEIRFASAMSLSYSWVLSIVASDFSTASNAFFSASSDISFAFLYASSDVFIAEAILI